MTPPHATQLVQLTFASVALLSPAFAGADERVVDARPRDVATYPVEVELHGAIGAENVYAAAGFGVGARASIPLVAGTLGHRYRENLAVTLGGDFLNYESCYYAARCGANYLLFPLAAQWNVFFGQRWSAYAEAGAFVYEGFFDGCVAGSQGCSPPSSFGILPTVGLGGRFRVADDVTLIARVGYPTSTLGVSFL